MNGPLKKQNVTNVGLGINVTLNNSVETWRCRRESSLGRGSAEAFPDSSCDPEREHKRLQNHSDVFKGLTLKQHCGRFSRTVWLDESPLKCRERVSHSWLWLILRRCGGWFWSGRRTRLTSGPLVPTLGAPRWVRHVQQLPLVPPHVVLMSSWRIFTLTSTMFVVM